MKHFIDIADFNLKQLRCDYKKSKKIKKKSKRIFKKV